MDTSDLENRIQILEQWKTDRERQQITYPLDINSQVVLNKYFMSIVNSVTFVAGAGGHSFTTYLGQQGQYNFEISPANLTSYSVNISTDYITVQSYLRFFNGNVVNIATTDTPPSPLMAGVDYYVINSDGTTFQLSLTAGGSAINITTTGTGGQYISFV